jgi:hypothetical protein
MPRATSRASGVLQRATVLLALLLVAAALLSPWLLARGARGAQLAPEAAFFAGNDGAFKPDPPCPLSALPRHRGCTPTR